MNLRPLSLILAALILSFLAPLASQAETAKPAIYLSVFKAGENTFWAQKTCQKIYNLVQNTDYPGSEVHCDWNQDENFLSDKSKLARRSGYFQFMLELKETATEYHLRWVNWNPIDDVDVTQAGWTLKKQPDTDLYLRKLFNHILEQKNYAIGLRRHFVTQALLQKQGSVIALPLSTGQIYSFLESDLKKKLYVKTALQANMMLGLGVTDDIKNKEAAQLVWDQDTTSVLLGSLSKLKTPINWPKINSQFEMPLICRAQNLKDLDQLLCSQIASMTWNMILDYHQILSLKNESLIEAIEAYFVGTIQSFQKLMQEHGNSLIKKNLQTIFMAPQDLEKLIPISDRGRGTDLNIMSNVGVAKNRSSEIPLFNTPQGPKKLITSIDFKEHFRDPSMDSIYHDFKTTLEIGMAAYYEKDQRFHGSPASLQGYNFFIGPKKALDNRTPFNLAADPRRSDFIGSVHVFGSTLRMVTYSHGWRIRAVLDIYADFASVRSYALDQYQYNPQDGLGLPQPNHNDYYYAVGATNLAQIVFEYGNWSFDISAQNQQLSNLNGRSPQPTITGARADHFTGLEFGTQYQLSEGLSLRLALNETQRSGMAQDVGTRSNVIQAIIAQLIYRF